MAIVVADRFDTGFVVDITVDLRQRPEYWKVEVSIATGMLGLSTASLAGPARPYNILGISDLDVNYHIFF